MSLGIPCCCMDDFFILFFIWLTLLCHGEWPGVALMTPFLCWSQAAEKEAALQEQKRLQKAAAKGSKKGEKPGDKGDHSAPQSGKTAGSSGKWSATVIGARTVEDGSRKRKVRVLSVTLPWFQRLGQGVCRRSVFRMAKCKRNSASTARDSMLLLAA